MTLVCLVLVATACGARDRPGEPTAELSADSLLLPAADIRQIAGFDGLNEDPAAPTDQRQPDPSAPGPCKVALDQQVIFGSEITDFRTVSFGAQTNTAPGQIRGMAIVSQAVGVFPSDEAARTAFDKLEPMARECSALKAKHYEYDVATPNPTTLTLTSNAADIVYRVQSSALLSVVVVGLPDSDRIANSVAESMIQRMR